MSEFVLPNDTERLAIFGKTGSGKTQAACWHLSNAAFDRMPWIVLAFKPDPEGIIENMPGAHEIGLGDRLPKHPGIYWTQPMVFDKDDKEKLDDFFRRVWTQRKIGLYIDEGYVASGCRWFRACLTQGRSLRIPMIILSQQTVWMDTFVWSEADYYQAFQLNRKPNIDTADAMIPGYREARKSGLPAYHSVWHDVPRDRTFVLSPVPDRDTILQSFRDRRAVKTHIVA